MCNNNVFIISVSEFEECENGLKYYIKKAMLLKLPGVVIEKGEDNYIRYKFGEVIHGGELGYDCFYTKEEALERVNGLNKYFRENIRW